MTGNDAPKDGGTSVAAASESAKPAKKRSGGGAFAVLLSLVALGLSGYVAWQFQALPSRLSDDSNRLAGIDAELRGRIDQLAGQAEQQQAALSAMRDSLRSEISAVADLPDRMAQLQEQVANVPGINARSRADFLRAEALYYLRIANTQAVLAKDADIAASALQLADEKLRDSGDPGVAAVRARLSEELAALRAVPSVDSTGISFRLQAMASQADSWPFRNKAPDSYVREMPDSDMPDSAAAAWDRFKATVSAAFNSIVSVKATDEPRVTQLGLAEEALVVESIKAELQVARLALIGGNSNLYTQSLARVTEQVSAYFDPEAQSVVAAIESLNELSRMELAGPLPDISGSLALLVAGAPQAKGGEQ